ncbi:MAG: hypothetical protein RXQ56_02880 [Thermoproteus sp.]
MEGAAKSLRENLGGAILIVDPLIPVLGASWRRPTEDELRDATESEEICGCEDPYRG